MTHSSSGAAHTLAHGSGGTIRTNAALCTLTVSSKHTLETDVVLQLVLNLACPHQVKVVFLDDSSCATVTTSTSTRPTGTSKNQTHGLLLLEHVSGTIRLTQRSAILRALAGTVLHYSSKLDSLLLGGHGASSQNGGSSKSVFAMSSLISWMTLAQGFQHDQQQQQQEQILELLESFLENHAFLIPSSRATLADMEMCMAILNKYQSSLSVLKTTGGEDQSSATWIWTPNICRWMTTVHAQMIDLGAKQRLPPLPFSTGAYSTIIPIFFDGSQNDQGEDMEQQLGAASSQIKPRTVATLSSASAASVESGNQSEAIMNTASSSPKTQEQPSGLTDEQKKAAADKRAKKAAEKAMKKSVVSTSSTAAPTDAVLDISALDIRIGKICKVWNHPDAEKLFCEEIDVGEGQPRQIASGLRPFYSSNDLMNQYVLVLCNLKPRPLLGFVSHGMVLCASNKDHTKVELMVPGVAITGASVDDVQQQVVVGERVVFQNVEMGPPESEAKVAKKKLLEKLLPDLQTNADGVMVWKKNDNDHVATTSTSGLVLKAIQGMDKAHVG